MPSAYLTGSDLAAYGVPNATPQQVMLASSLIDGYLQRQEGLIWAPDANGNPCYMLAKVPAYTLNAIGAITPGASVNIPFTGPAQIPQTGLVLILDRGNPSLTEACIINTVTFNTPPTPNVIQLINVQFPHSAGCTMEGDMTIFEECQMPQGRPNVNVSRYPVQNVIAGRGRYAYARRNQSYANLDIYNLLATITQFGGPPTWEVFDQTKVSINPTSSMLWAPCGVLIAYYSEIHFSYIAGYTYANLPSAIKFACANIINAAINVPMNGSIQNYRAGDTAINRFSDTYFDRDTKALLEPFKSRMAF